MMAEGAAPGKTVSVIAGTSYFGQLVSYTLAEKGYNVIVTSRHPQRHAAMRVHPGISLKKGNVADRSILKKLAQESHIVINLLDKRTGDAVFFSREVPKLIGQFSSYYQVEKLIQLSTAGASSTLFHNPHLHAQAMGEKNLLALHKTRSYVLQAGWMVGKSIATAPAGIVERLLQRMARTRVFPYIGGKVRIAPVHIQDVLRLLVDLLEDKGVVSRRVVIAGPESMTVGEFLRRIKTHSGLKVRLRPAGRLQRLLRVGNSFLFPPGYRDFLTPLDGSGYVRGERIQGTRSVAEALQEVLYDGIGPSYSDCRKLAAR